MPAVATMNDDLSRIAKNLRICSLIISSFLALAQQSSLGHHKGATELVSLTSNTVGENDEKLDGDLPKSLKIRGEKFAAGHRTCQQKTTLSSFARWHCQQCSNFLAAFDRALLFLDFLLLFDQTESQNLPWETTNNYHVCIFLQPVP
jgi:hypothetical protein